MRDYIGAMAATMELALGLALVLSFVLGALTMWGLPKLWAWLMPIIHMATA